MFEITKRSIAAIKKIHTDRKNHKRKMKIIKKNEDWALKVIDQAFENIRKEK